MKKHPFSDGKTCDVDIKKVFSNSVGSQLPWPFPVSTIYIIYLFIRGNNVTTSSGCRIRAFVSDVIYDVQSHVLLILPFHTLTVFPLNLATL